MNCSKCQSDRTIKYGHTHYGKQRFQCLDCGRQKVENPTRQPIDETTRNLIDKLLQGTVGASCDCTSDGCVPTVVTNVR